MSPDLISDVYLIAQSYGNPADKDWTYDTLDIAYNPKDARTLREYWLNNLESKQARIVVLRQITYGVMLE